MVYIGMIYQYNEVEGSGLVMLPEGESRSFSRQEWVESETEPAVGQKIAYADRQNGVQIKLANADDQVGMVYEEDEADATVPVVEEESAQEEQVEEVFGSVDECISYYTGRGFKPVKDVGDEQSRTVTLRMYTPAEYGEVIIKHEGTKLSVTQMINGETERIC